MRVGDELYGHGDGPLKKEAEQQAAETAYREIVAEHRRRAAPMPARRTTALSREPVPELPEVEVVRRGLEPTSSATGSPPSRCSTRGRSAGTSPAPTHFAPALTGRAVVAARRRRGKYLWLPLDSGDALLAHLGMSGQMLVQPADRARTSATCGSGSASTDRAGRELRFVDQRMFGGLAVSAGGAELPAEIAHIARDPLDPEFDDDGVRAPRARARTSGIKRILLDQTLVSGVGNIYADEALWRARLHGDRPRRPAHRGRRSASCSRHVREVMAEALRRAARRSTRSTSTSTARAATSTARWRSTARRVGRAPRCGTPIARARS